MGPVSHLVLPAFVSYLSDYVLYDRLALETQVAFVILLCLQILRRRPHENR
jgi:hypothetical protein